MDLLTLNANERRTSRHATMAVVLCFAMAGVILAVSLLWPAGVSALGVVPAVPR